MTPDQVQGLSVISDKLSSTRRTGGIAELMKALLRLKETGHRCRIMLSDQVFLLALISWLSSITPPVDSSPIALANNPEYHARTKHIDVQSYFVSECVEGR